MFCGLKPRLRSSFAASITMPPGIPFRSSETSANFCLPRWITAVRAQSLVCWPLISPSERTQPIM